MMVADNRTLGEHVVILHVLWHDKILTKTMA